ncbi:phage head-tail joining protein [Rhodoligotrophos ferricapiens]|uniref:phage head-tail joining protein n=1 Tax=Rhodoligotrophos ferricapiens TaxID=3069264 RepID=UPI00315D37B7
MAWTQRDLDNLKSAIAQGVTSARIGDRQVQYRSLQEMRETLALIEAEVSGTSARRSRQFRFRTSKGL